ncbi:major facilitator superfamily domain-containing protein, partial [Aspergillus novoparasiticus]
MQDSPPSPDSSLWTLAAKAEVNFNGPNDPLNPLNWPGKKKAATCTILSISTMIVASASSIFAPAIPAVMRAYDIQKEVATLGVSLYVFGFAFGPLIFGPLSERKGRYFPLVWSMLGFTLSSFATGISDSMYALFIFRFLAGFFGSGPLTIAGPAFADMFTPEQRGVPVVTFCLMVFIGPLTAPFIGGFILMNPSLSWRWTAYIPGFCGAAVFLILATFLPETFQPVILMQKARRLRREAGDWSFHSVHEEALLDTTGMLTGHLTLPLKMMVQQPIVLCMCVFGSFVYGLLYLFLTAYPYVFQVTRGMNPGVGGLPYIGIVVGTLFGAIAIGAMQPWVLRKMKENGGEMMPEWRLPAAIPGSVLFTSGLFWLGWSGHTNTIHWIVPTASGIFTGFGLLTMFLSSLAYLVDSMGSRSASAIAA